MKVVRFLLVASLIFVLFVATALLVLPWYGTIANYADNGTVIIIPTGSSLRGAAKRLEKARLVGSTHFGATHFVILARLLGSNAPIKAGEYKFDANQGWNEYLHAMQTGTVIQHLITIPEGLPSILVAQRLAAEPLLTGPTATPREGHVLPDTYAFQRGETRAAVLARMTTAMDRTLARLWEARASTAPVRTREDALTLASIVEKETAVPAERPIVAGVYANRLRQGIKLDADPTVWYPITKGRPLGRPIRQSDLHADTGYNTYLKPGLPKGPIANPGRLSIAAALNPAPTPALYFVANGHGGHVFAATLAEQSRNVAHWRALGH